MSLSQVTEDSSWETFHDVVVEVNLQSLSRNVTWNFSEVPEGSGEHSGGGVVLIPALIVVYALGICSESQENHYR